MENLSKVHVPVLAYYEVHHNPEFPELTTFDYRFNALDGEHMISSQVKNVPVYAQPSTMPPKWNPAVSRAVIDVENKIRLCSLWGMRAGWIANFGAVVAALGIICIAAFLCSKLSFSKSESWAA